MTKSITMTKEQYESVTAQLVRLEMLLQEQLINENYGDASTLHKVKQIREADATFHAVTAAWREGEER